MKLRWIAMAGVAAMALSAPAFASDATGWYLGLGVGYSALNTINYHFTGSSNPSNARV
jgi:opacity protein-like surface antigen